MADPIRSDDVHCLTEDIIQKFLTGELDDEQDEGVSNHLDECGSCQRLTMKFLSVDDLCLPWIKASARDTIDLARQAVDTATLDILKQMPWKADQQPQSDPGATHIPETFKVSPVPDRIDKYEIVAVIGQGGMGTVYLGIDHDLGCECAIKVLKESRCSNPKAMRRSHREIHAIGRLTHPNIVAVLNDGTLEDNRTFLAMEFLRGCDLQSFIQEHGPLPPDEACRIAIEAARGLQHAHEHGFVHRDVKPSNLFRTEDGLIKLLDFGLVHIKHESLDSINALTETGLVLGTVDFMSPEQALNSRSANPRSDIYSLGCTLAWLLSGQPMFPGKSVTRVLFAHRDDPAPQLEQLQPNVPAGLNSVFQKMVAKQPEDRFQSMAEAIDALTPFTLMQHESPVAELSPSPPTELLPATSERTAQVPARTVHHRIRTIIGWLGVIICGGILITLVAQQLNGKTEPTSAQTSKLGKTESADGQSATVHVSTTGVDIRIDTDGTKPDITVRDTESLVPPSTEPVAQTEPIPTIELTRVPILTATPTRTLIAIDGVSADQLVEHAAICDLDVSADGSELLVAASNGAQVWDTSSPFEATLKSSRVVRESAWIRAVERVPGKNSFLAVNSDHSALLQSFDNDSARVLNSGRGSSFTSLVLSDDGTRAWAGTYHAFGGRVLEFGLTSGDVARWLRIEPEEPGSACLRLERSPDGRLLAAGGALTGGTTLIETESLTERHRLPTRGPIRSVAFSFDSSFVVTSADEDCVRAWDTDSGQELWRIPESGPCSAMEFSADGSRLYLATYPRPNLRLLTLDVARKIVLGVTRIPWACDSLAIDPLGRFVAAGNGFLPGLGNGRILLWKTEMLTSSRASTPLTTALQQ